MDKLTVKSRIISLDVFRGLTIAAMLIVNNPGTYKHIFAPLRHAVWQGLTPTDLIFPFFLFIVGMAIPLSLNPRLIQQTSLATVSWRILRRMFLLILLGLVLNGFPFKGDHLRFPGVLQRIGLCYGLASFIYLACHKKNNEQNNSSVLTLGFLFFALLTIYFICMKYVPVPGQGAGLLNSKENNLAAYIDRLIMNGHLWAYAKYRWDPEGLFSTISALATTLSGIICCWWLQKTISTRRKLLGMVLVGTGMLILGYSISPFFPINKSLWSSSYVLVSSGLALIIFSGIYWYADVKTWSAFMKPFQIFGTNAILAYFLSSFTAKCLVRIKLTTGVSLKAWIFQTCFQPLTPYMHLNSLLYALSYTLIWFGLLYVLYHKKWFIRL
ncbi:DUF5009 domain-containing protein [bacterium]|nr:DUF5009 domain-containing protein [bacterium]